MEEVSTGKAKERVPDVPKPVSAAAVRAAKPTAKRFDSAIDAPPAFHSGDSVRAKSHITTGHTRLPAYVRGYCGRISGHHGAHVFPDESALNKERHEHLYTVEFDAVTLWPEVKESRDSVLLNLWESYLERA